MSRTMLPLLRKIYRFLASLKLAVILLVMLMVVLAAATYYESVYDARTAQHLVYGSLWFALFLLLLGVNVFCAAAVRFPWRVHQVGFVVTHAGILVILAGSFVTMLWGVDGQMAVMEGQSASGVFLDRPVLRVIEDTKTYRDIDAEFRWDPPRDGHEFRLDVGNGVTAVVDRYYHQAAEEIEYVPGDGPPAVQLRLHGGMADVTQWLTTRSGSVSMGPATLRLREARTPEELQRLLSPDHKEGRQGVLQMLVKGFPVALDIEALGKAPASLPEGHSVRLVRYLPHAVVRDGKLESASKDPVNPAIEVEFTKGKSTETWLLFGLLPDLTTKTSQKGDALDIRCLYTFEGDEHQGHDHGPGEGHKTLELVLAPDGQVHYRLDSGATGVAPAGKNVPTGWMDFRFTVEKVVPKAREQKNFREMKLANGQEGPGAAIRLRVEGARDTSPHWLRSGDTIEVEPLQGTPFHLGYGLKMVDVGFKLKLLDFEIGYDPGTRNAASYKSTVQVDGADASQVIQMNEPLKKNGYTFFQSSFQEMEGQPMVSIFSVAYDPGIMIKYLGSLMLVLGIALHFYLRPYLIRREHAKALAEMQGREEASRES